MRSRIPWVKLPCKAPEENLLIAKFLASLFTAALVLQKMNFEVLEKILVYIDEEITVIKS